jgi:agmatine deiminase
MALFRMPAEWEPHTATYLTWPHNRETWPGKFEVIPAAYAELVAAIARFEPVRLIVAHDGAAEEARKLIAAAAGDASVAARVDFVCIATNDSWIRDYGPIFLNRRGGAADPDAQIALDWHFNSWGKKYGPYELDDAVPRQLGRHFGFEVIEPDIVLEGGAIDVNGAGVVMTTEACLLNPNRNPSLDRSAIEDYLKTYLGVSTVLWLGDGIAGDDTDGHVDDLARFVSAGTVVTVVEPDSADENHRPLADNLERLRHARGADGRPLRIETIPMPPAQFHEGIRVPASYVNFYIANGGVIMPTFDCDADLAAKATLQRLFPERTVVGVPAKDLVWGLGTVHCLSQQHPAP